MQRKLVFGVDFGTDSVRSVLIDSADGSELASAVFEYPRWKKGLYCEPAINQFRQHPLDYIEGLEYTVKEAMRKAGNVYPDEVVGMTIDTTGSTPVAVDRGGIPLSLKEEFAENPNAMFILWKDHTAVKEAEEVNRTARTWGGIDYTKYEGGVYSSEWLWAKILHILRMDEKIRETAFSWVEHCDWMPALLTGNTNPPELKRSRCAAGHKAMWHEEFGGLPSEEFLFRLDPLLAGLRDRLYTDTFTSDFPAGNLSEEWAKRLGLTPGVVVGVGAFDAHLGAVGGEVKPGYLSKVVGTSTCDMMVAPVDQFGNKLVKGICGQVDGSVIPGMLGLEAGQSAFGDVYAWFRNLLLWPLENIPDKWMNDKGDSFKHVTEEISNAIIPTLSEEAEKIPVDESGIIALDWLNGRRTPDANSKLKGAIIGLSLGSDAPRIFRALVEATAFGSKRIVDRFVSEGIDIHGVIALGGVAKKSPFVMQVLADVLNMPIKVARSDQAVALGAAMAAAVVAGVYRNFEEAQQAMGSGFETEYNPVPERAEKYKTLYDKYYRLGAFIEKEMTDS
ncbi:MAG: ribulokinase [Chlorobi bacterium]|nr:ribulokinase [Chlorobiota bacterium]